MTVTLGDFEFDHVVYDPHGDVLYLSAGEPREPAHQESTPDGHLVRYDDAGRVIGITVVNAKWLVERDGLIEILVRLPADDLALALA
jgi:uncharacterized protein YuzE